MIRQFLLYGYFKKYYDKIILYIDVKSGGILEAIIDNVKLSLKHMNNLNNADLNILFKKLPVIY